MACKIFTKQKLTPKAAHSHTLTQAKVLQPSSPPPNLLPFPTLVPLFIPPSIPYSNCCVNLKYPPQAHEVNT